MFEAFSPLDRAPTNIATLIQKFPQLFSAQSKAPEKDTQDTLNEFIITNAKKYIESLHQQARKEPEPMSESDPAWNSDE